MKAKKQASVRTAQTTAYVRDAAVAEYTRRLANGQCDLCEKQAPFLNKRHEAYLECHHIIWLAQGGDLGGRHEFNEEPRSCCRGS